MAARDLAQIENLCLGVGLGGAALWLLYLAGGC